MIVVHYFENGPSFVDRTVSAFDSSGARGGEPEPGGAPPGAGYGKHKEHDTIQV